MGPRVAGSIKETGTRGQRVGRSALPRSPGPLDSAWTRCLWPEAEPAYHAVYTNGHE